MSNTKTRRLAIAATVVAGLMVAGCGANGGDSGSDKQIDGHDPVTLTFWQNNPTGPVMEIFQSVARDFEESHPWVTVEVTGIQSEDIKTKINAALQGGEAPDLFQQWGGGEMAAQIEAGVLMDISESAADVIPELGAAVSMWQYDGKTYGLPYSAGIQGFYYSQELFKEAGVEEPPTTLPDFYKVLDKLKGVGVAPIGLNGQDEWPVAHYWNWFALRECDQSVFQESIKNRQFDDACFVKAGEDLQALADSTPFEDGFMGISTQLAAGSAAGLLAVHQVGMELQGIWEPGTITWANSDVPMADLGWFPFPEVPGGKGDQKAAIGGGDGFSCYVDAPAECVEFLKAIVAVAPQTAYGESGYGMPVVAGSEGGITDPVLKQVWDAQQNVSFMQQELNSALGSTVGGAQITACADLLAGTQTPQGVVDAINEAAAQE